MKRINKVRLLIMLALSLLIASQVCCAKTYTDKQRSLSVYVPDGWRFQASEKIISISKNEDTTILLIPLAGVKPEINSIALLCFIYDLAKKEYPDIQILDKRMSPQGNIAQVIVQYTSETRQKVKSLYISRLENGYGMLCGFDAPINNFNKVHNEFKKVLGSLKFNTRTFYQTQKSKPSGSGKTWPQRPSYNFGQMVLKQTPDGGCYGMVPQHWTVGGGLVYGGSSIVLAEDPNPANSIGAIVKTYSIYSGLNYQSPGDYFLQEVLPNFPATGQQMFSNIQIIRRYSDQEELNELAKQGLRGVTETVEFQAYINMYGKTVRCIFTTSICSIQGIPIVNIAGIWAPPEIFDSTKQILKNIARSFGTNQAAVQQKIAAQNAATAKLSQTLSETTDIVISATDQHMRDTNRIIDKWSYYSKGEQPYYSEIEDRIYVGKAEWGEYVQNPNWSNETMTTNVPDHLWDKLEHEKPWQWQGY